MLISGFVAFFMAQSQRTTYFILNKNFALLRLLNKYMIDCKAHLKQYSVKALDCLDKSIELKIIITEKEKKLQEILKELALIKADEIIKLRVE